jgi:hypothetical protein
VEELHLSVIECTLVNCGRLKYCDVLEYTYAAGPEVPVSSTFEFEIVIEKLKSSTPGSDQILT